MLALHVNILCEMTEIDHRNNSFAWKASAHAYQRTPSIDKRSLLLLLSLELYRSRSSMWTWENVLLHRRITATVIPVREVIELVFVACRFRYNAIAFAHRQPFDVQMLNRLAPISMHSFFFFCPVPSIPHTAFRIPFRILNKKNVFVFFFILSVNIWHQKSEQLFFFFREIWNSYQNRHHRSIYRKRLSLRRRSSLLLLMKTKTCSRFSF